MTERCFLCYDCKHEWTEPYCTGRPQECPKCKSKNIHRAPEDRDWAREVVENDNLHHIHGMCQPMKVLADKNIDAVVCSGMGVRAIQKMNESRIKVYKTIPGTVSEIVN